MLFLSAADFTTQRVAARGTICGYNFDTGSMPFGDLTGWVEELIESNNGSELA